MAKVTYLEIVEMLVDRVQITSADLKRLQHIVARKKALKEEDSDLDGILDGILKELQGTDDSTKDFNDD